MATGGGTKEALMVTLNLMGALWVPDIVVSHEDSLPNNTDAQYRCNEGCSALMSVLAHGAISLTHTFCVFT